jgi:hypothetical protein
METEISLRLVEYTGEDVRQEEDTGEDSNLQL